MRFLSVTLLILSCLGSVTFAAETETCQVQQQNLDATREQLALDHVQLKAEASAIGMITTRQKAESDQLEANTLKLQHEQEKILALGRTLDIKQSPGEPLLYKNEIADASRSQQVKAYNQQAKSFNQRQAAHNAEIRAYNQALAAQQQRIDSQNAATQIYNEKLRALRTAMETYKQRCP